MAEWVVNPAFGKTALGSGRANRAGLREVLSEAGGLSTRLQRLRDFGRKVRSSEYHLTNACNIRCENCWFFSRGFDRRTEEESSLQTWQEFARHEAVARGVTAALLIGGEPTLFLDRIAAFVQHMKYVTVSSNGILPLPKDGFEQVCVALTLFGGSRSDDHLRGIRPSGSRLAGLFDKTLGYYRNDPRAIFIFALDVDGVDEVEDTVRRIRDNGNIVTFNYYSRYDSDDPLRRDSENRLLDEALRVADLYPEAVVCDAYYIQTLISGKTTFGEFSYEVCPSISVTHPDHKARLKNGRPFLPKFNSYAADAKSLNFCCTSGDCASCRDSQAVYSWLMVSVAHFLSTRELLETWVRVAESYWAQFIWSPYHRTATQDRPALSERA